MNDPITLTDTKASASLSKVGEMLRTCIQCGTCSGSCPNEFAMDITPRQLWRLVLVGYEAPIFQSRTFTLCSSCFTCTLRCPRDLPLTEAMSALKRLACRRGLRPYRQSTLFYKSFMESVRRHGRVREMELMTLYFAHLKHPFLPMRFAPLGLKLLSKGKVSLQLPSRGQGKLAAIFKKAQEMER